MPKNKCPIMYSSSSSLKHLTSRSFPFVRFLGGVQCPLVILYSTDVQGPLSRCFIIRAHIVETMLEFTGLLTALLHFVGSHL